MKLVDFAFNMIKNGKKDIEVRLNDEKRQLINVGDRIIFTNTNSGEIIRVKVINLYKFNSFKDLFQSIPLKRIGFDDGIDYTIMNNFYTEEEQKKYGALGIEISLE